MDIPETPTTPKTENQQLSEEQYKEKMSRLPFKILMMYTAASERFTHPLDSIKFTYEDYEKELISYLEIDEEVVKNLYIDFIMEFDDYLRRFVWNKDESADEPLKKFFEKKGINEKGQTEFFNQLEFTQKELKEITNVRKSLKAAA